MAQGLVRIISGSLRGRRLKVPDVKDLRPTPDRVRETLFNWLAPVINGARCLDLFAGSGILGFEAISRGAAYAELVDHSPAVIELLKQEAWEFGLENIKIYKAKAPEGLSKPDIPFDIVFIDPPYQSDLIPTVAACLTENGFLAPTAYIYLEAKEVIKDNELPANWRLLKARRAGQVYYHLAICET